MKNTGFGNTDYSFVFSEVGRSGRRHGRSRGGTKYRCGLWYTLKSRSIECLLRLDWETYFRKHLPRYSHLFLDLFQI